MLPITRVYILGFGLKITKIVKNNDIIAIMITNIFLFVIDNFALGIHDIQAGIRRI